MTPTQIKSARENLGLTQPELAKLIGVSRVMTISDWERGVNRVPEKAAKLVRLILKHGVSA
jgi:DNA-binding transcriptional regulator YiaG